MEGDATPFLPMDIPDANTVSAHSPVKSSWNVLNLYAGLGGNRKLWDATVTAVERQEDIAAVYQSQFPNDTVVVGDAHAYLESHFARFDFIWSSPPCQTHSRMNRSGCRTDPRYIDLRLYEEILFLQTHCKGKWVVENVVPYYQPLVVPTAQIGRHVFWSNFTLRGRGVDYPVGFIASGGRQATTDELKQWLDLSYGGNLYYDGGHCPAQVLRNCVHPIVGKQILEAAMRAQ